MKRTITFATVVLLAVVVAYFGFAAAETQAVMGKGKAKADSKQMAKCTKAMMKCPGHMMMCKSMMEKEIVAVDDGVVVMTAGKLYKYDKDLNLVKEVELKACEDMKEKMKKMREECMEKCQMMKTKDKPAE